MTVCLLTGGCGYIGSHCYVALMRAGYHPVVLDNFSNSDPDVLRRLQLITGSPVTFYEGDVADQSLVASIIARHRVQAVVHFAALKSVGDSVVDPLTYYRSNVGGTTALLGAMQSAGCRVLIYSSSAAVYGTPERMPITEQASCTPQSPYGHTKLMGEQIIRSLVAAPDQGAGREDRWHAGILRYFNPAGAHPSGLLGEAPLGVPSNLVPYVSQVAAGLRPFVRIFGDDYDTADGTGVRDYIHVMDLADGHVAALSRLLRSSQQTLVLTLNLGTGTGYSVREVIDAFSRVSGRRIECRVEARRSGDVAACWADPTRAQTEIGWQATRTLDDMCGDAWNWQCAAMDQGAP